MLSRLPVEFVLIFLFTLSEPRPSRCIRMSQSLVPHVEYLSLLLYRDYTPTWERFKDSCGLIYAFFVVIERKDDVPAGCKLQRPPLHTVAP